MKLSSVQPASLVRKKYLHIILPAFIGSVIAYLDRVNIAYAALTMNADLGFSAQVYGAGAGVFFIGYVMFEVPGAIIAERWSPRIWLSRILITWGIISCFMAFVQTPRQFYLVRFLLGAAEASFYPVIYASVIPRWFTPQERPQAIALMLTSLQISTILGAPLAGWLLGTAAFGLHGWQMLFLLESIPAVAFGVIILFVLADWPRDAPWLTEQEKEHLSTCFEQETAAKKAARHYTLWQALRDRDGAEALLHLFFVVHRLLGIQLLDAHSAQRAVGLVESCYRLADRHPHGAIDVYHDVYRRIIIAHGREALAWRRAPVCGSSGDGRRGFYPGPEG